MKVIVNITENFKKEVKPLLKKYSSLSTDLLQLEKELTINPRTGIPLGQDIYKIRLKISSKRKGKSGGARIISLVETLVSVTETYVTLVSIYDKSDTANISDKELKTLIKAYKSK